jgi:uncharacterized protein (TIGR03382 family)
VLLGFLFGAALVGEAWVTLPPGATADDLAAAGALVTEGRRDGQVRVLLDAATAAVLRERGFVLTDVRADHRRGAPPIGYHTQESGDALLALLAETSPRADLVRIGTSAEGRAIEGLRLGQDPASGARVVRVLGTHHGDEASSYEVTLAFAERLASGDGTDPDVTALLDAATVWVVPLVNPDGFLTGSRTNAAGVDLNRNYDWEWFASESFAGPAPFSEPETRAIRAFGLWSRPDTALTLHAGATNLGWPWNHTLDPTLDAGPLEALAEVYAEVCTTPDFWITQGSHWYLTRGDTNDWAYGWYGTFDMTLEVSHDPIPDAADLPVVAAEHVDAMLAFLGRTPTASGTVTDAITGGPIDAELTLGGGRFRTDPLTGAWARHAVLSGSDTLTVDAPGYTSASVAVSVGLQTHLTLEPTFVGSGWLTPSVLRWPREVELPDGATGSVLLRHPSAVPISVEDDDGRFELDPTQLAPGAWSVELPDGTVLLRALWVDDAVSARVDAWSTAPGGIAVTGSGFGEGARAVAFVGDARSVVPIPVQVEGEHDLVFDTSELPTDERVDVAVWTNGSLLGLDDVWTDQVVAWPTVPDPDVVDETTGCGCTSSDTTASGVLVGLVVLLSRRRSSGLLKRPDGPFQRAAVQRSAPERSRRTRSGMQRRTEGSEQIERPAGRLPGARSARRSAGC